MSELAIQLCTTFKESVVAEAGRLADLLSASEPLALLAQALRILATGDDATLLDLAPERREVVRLLLAELRPL